MVDEAEKEGGQGGAQQLAQKEKEEGVEEEKEGPAGGRQGKFAQIASVDQERRQQKGGAVGPEQKTVPQPCLLYTSVYNPAKK